MWQRPPRKRPFAEIYLYPNFHFIRTPSAPSACGQQTLVELCGRRAPPPKTICRKVRPNRNHYDNQHSLLSSSCQGFATITIIITQIDLYSPNRPARPNRSNLPLSVYLSGRFRWHGSLGGARALNIPFKGDMMSAPPLPLPPTSPMIVGSLDPRRKPHVPEV